MGLDFRQMLWGQVLIHVCFYKGMLIRHLVCGLVGTRPCRAWMGESSEIPTFHPCLRSPEPGAKKYRPLREQEEQGIEN